jgi:hypothetical protein
MLARTPLVLSTRRRFVHRRGSLFPVGPATSSPWVDAGHDRSSLYPISALASLLMLRVLLCPTTGTPTPVWGDVDTARGTAPPSHLRRLGLCPCRDCVAVLLALAVVAEPPALTRANPTVAFHTSSETEAPRSRPPRRSVSHHRRGRPSDRLGARASGQVSAGVRPHARTQANTPVSHRGARRRGQATDMPARSSEDMDAAFGRPMLTTAHASSPRSSEAKSRPSTC